MRKSARRLVMHSLKPRKTPRQEELVEEAVEAVADVEVDVVAEATVLLGTMITRSKVPTLVL
jgi:hypothetical protein